MHLAVTDDRYQLICLTIETAFHVLSFSFSLSLSFHLSHRLEESRGIFCMPQSSPVSLGPDWVLSDTFTRRLEVFESIDN